MLVKKAFLVVLCGAVLVGVLPAARAAAANAAPAPVAVAIDGPRVPGEVVVRFEEGTDPRARMSARRAVAAEDHARLGIPGLEVLELDGTSVRDAIEELEARPDVLYAEPNYVVTASATPNDSFFGQQWALNDATSGSADIDAPAAWDAAVGTDNVTVAVVDTGVAWDHPDLAENIWTNPGEAGANATNGLDDDGNGFVDDVRGWDWVDVDNDPMDVSGHGTHVAGTIGARGNNGRGVSGIGWNMKLMPLRVLAASGSGSTADVARAFDYAADQGAKVVNASFGGAGYSRATADVIAANPDVLFVAASGNESVNNESTPAYPCNLTYANVVCVAAITRTNSLASFSNFGATSVDLAAPGASILSTVPHRETLFSETFETDVSSRWTTSWGPEAGPSGMAYSDSPGTTYADSSETALTLTNPIDTSSANGCALSYRLNMDVLDGDYFDVESSTDGTTWRRSATYYGSTGGWIWVTNDLGSLGSGLQLRYKLRSDALGSSNGVALDDISLTCSTRNYSSLDYKYFSGTSMATPHVAGAAGVLFSAKPAATVAEIRTALLAGTVAVPSTVGLTVTGGRLNLANSLRLIIGATTEVPPASDSTGGTSGGGTLSGGGSTTAPAPAPAPEPTTSPTPTPPPAAEPTPEPTPEPETIEHARSVTLKVVRGPRLKGRVDVADAYMPCASGAKVVIRRNGAYVKTVTADYAGRFVTRVSSYRGTYTGKTISSTPAAGHVCLSAKAFSVR